MGLSDRAPDELIPGTLDRLILKTVSRETMHGYTIAQSIQRVSRDVLRVEEGSLYPALYRMVQKRWIKGDWGVSENNRRAKYYTLTAQGRRELEREAASWSRVAGAIARVMQSA